MAVTPADLKIFAPELADQSDPRLQMFIELAGDMLNVKAFGTRYDKGLLLLAAHLSTMAGRDGAGGAIASESLGDWSRSYSTGTTRDSELNMTSYGTMFLTLMKSLGVSTLVLNGCS